MRFPRSTQQTRREFLQLSAASIVRPMFGAQVPAGRVTTIVGNGVRGSAADGETMDRAQINNPFHVVIGPDGALYWSDFGTHRVLRADLRTKRLSVVAGNGTKGYSGDGGPAKSAQLNGPHEVRFDSKGNLYVVERDNAIVRRVEMKSGSISTVAGTGQKCGAFVSAVQSLMRGIIRAIRRQTLWRWRTNQ